MFDKYEDNDFENYAGNAIPRAYGCDVDTVTFELHKTARELFMWFENNQMKAYPEQSHLLKVESPIKILLKSDSCENFVGIYKHGHNILRLFHTLPNFLFTKSETKCYY